MKLAPELVPRTLWWLSANELLSSAWRRRIRPAIVADFGGRCGRCGGVTPRMFAHEEWHYDEEAALATLTGLALVCQDCNSCLHFGRLPARYQRHALEHLAAVNGVSLREAAAVVSEALAQWQRRSELSWRITVSPQLVERFDVLAELPERAALRRPQA